jgi:hypothetical protein
MESFNTELNPDGTKDIKITNEQIVERAIELYNESNANEMKQSTKVVPPTVQTQTVETPTVEAPYLCQRVLML